MSKMQAYIKPAPESHCRQCGRKMERQRFSSGRLEDLGRFMKRKSCSKKCQDESLIKTTVTVGQYRFRARMLRADCCDLCGSAKNLQVHHKDKDLSNNTLENLQTLCASCHNTLHWLERKGHGPCD
jgi:hypothetical protein